MYKLRDFLVSIFGLKHTEVLSDEIYCSESDSRQTRLINRMQEALGAYSYTLVRRGWLMLDYNDKQLMLRQGDLMVYSPGVQIALIDASDDYRSAVLIVDEQEALENPGMRYVIRTAYLPIMELGQPVVHLSREQADHFWQLMQEILSYRHSSHRYLAEILRTLYSQFLLDLMDAMEQSIGQSPVSERATELFVAFMRLLSEHFIEHHDLRFYAQQLHITTIHLSRVVRQLTGRTVADFINQMLLMESMWLLQSTDLSIAAVAERLRFADQSSFGRFFTRMRGVAPKAYRMRM